MAAGQGKHTIQHSPKARHELSQLNKSVPVEIQPKSSRTLGPVASASTPLFRNCVDRLTIRSSCGAAATQTRGENQESRNFNP